MIMHGVQAPVGVDGSGFMLSHGLSAERSSCDDVSSSYSSGRATRRCALKIFPESVNFEEMENSSEENLSLDHRQESLEIDVSDDEALDDFISFVVSKMETGALSASDNKARSGSSKEMPIAKPVKGRKRANSESAIASRPPGLLTQPIPSVNTAEKQTQPTSSGNQLEERQKSCLKTDGRSTLARSSSVRFNSVEVREYVVEIGDSPACPSGPALAIGWEYFPSENIPVSDYERIRPDRRSGDDLVMTRIAREDRLKEFGFSKVDFQEAKRISKGKSPKKKKRSPENSDCRDSPRVGRRVLKFLRIRRKDDFVPQEDPLMKELWAEYADKRYNRSAEF